MLRFANYRCGIILFGFFVRSFLILTFFFYYSPAYAHDLWSNGKTVPEWVKKSCCGAEDVHHLRPDQVHDLGDYYTVDGYRRPIDKKAAQILPSQDGDYGYFTLMISTESNRWSIASFFHLTFRGPLRSKMPG